MSDITLGADGSLQSEPWFAKPNVDVLFYRINRRPILADLTFFDPDPDLLGHLKRVLDHAEPGHSGRKNKREWLLGSLQFNDERGTFVGKLGWAKSAAALGPAWDAGSHEWIERVMGVWTGSAGACDQTRAAFLGSARADFLATQTSMEQETTISMIIDTTIGLQARRTGFTGPIETSNRCHFYI